MKYRRKSDGKEFPSLGAAVQDFKCPGPCNPDCGLYTPKPIGAPAGQARRFVNMCSPEYYSLEPGKSEVIAFLGIEPVPGTEHWQDYDPKTAYLALIRAGAVRDAQVCANADCEPADDDAWSDCKNAEIYLGVFEGPTALEDAAAYGCTVPENIRLIPLDNLKEKRAAV